MSLVFCIMDNQLRECYYALDEGHRAETTDASVAMELRSNASRFATSKDKNAALKIGQDANGK